MIVLLPPSEGKTAPAVGAPLELSDLANECLTPAREQVLDALIRMCTRTPTKARTVLGLSPNQRDEVSANAGLATANTAPAWQVYTGVLFGALDFGSLSAAARKRAAKRLLIMSSLFGIVRPDDPIVAYRLSGVVTLPKVGKVDRFWRHHLGLALSDSIGDGLVIDMRSGTYVKFWPIPPHLASQALTVKIWQLGPNGSRTAVSHHNKAAKGDLARLLATTTSAPRTRSAIVDLLRDHNWDAQLSVDPKIGHDRLDVTID